MGICQGRRNTDQGSQAELQDGLPSRRDRGLSHPRSATYLCGLVGIGVPLAEVRDLQGHASVVVTERYAPLSPDNVRAAVAQLDNPMSRFGHADATQGKEVASDGVITA